MDLIDFQPQILAYRQMYCAFIYNILFCTNFCLWGMALVLSEATFDQLVELPGVGPTRAQQLLQLREEAAGELRGLGYVTLGECIGRASPIQEKLFSRVMV